MNCNDGFGSLTRLGSSFSSGSGSVGGDLHLLTWPANCLQIQKPGQTSPTDGPGVLRFLAAVFLAAVFLAAGFLAAFLAAGFLAAGFLAAVFLAAGFLVADFLAVAVLVAVLPCPSLFLLCHVPVRDGFGSLTRLGSSFSSGSVGSGSVNNAGGVLLPIHLFWRAQ